MRAFVTAIVLCACVMSGRAQSLWEPPTHVFSSWVTGLVVTETGVVVAGTLTDGIYRSVDNTQTWQAALPDAFVNSMLLSNGRIFAATDEGLYVSDDDGLSWSALMHATANGVSVDGERVVAGGRGGQLYFSEDAGESWTVPSCPLMPEGFDSFVDPVAISGNVILYEHGLDAQFRSEDGGATWVQEDPLYTSWIETLPDGRIVADRNGSIVSSVDGRAWSTIAESPFFGIRDGEIVGDLVAVASFSGAAASNDGGSTWTDFTTGLMDEEAYVVAIGPDGHLYAGDECCVRRSVEPIGDPTASSKHAGREIPSEHALISSYPNPTAGIVRIEFVLAYPAAVDLSVFDAVGRKIGSVLSRELPMGGYEVKWDPGRLAPGTYFVRLDASGRSITRSLSIVR